MKVKQKEYSPAPMEGEKVVEINLDRLVPFQNHPFHVCQDKDMLELMESIRRYGIVTPLIVRSRLDGDYEIISGHRRKYAAEHLGFYKVPVIVRPLIDDDSIICMVDSNLQRERILPSEKAFVYKMKYEAMKRKTGKQNKNDESQVGQKVKYRRSIDELGALGGDSSRQVGRYIRLTHLHPDILKKVDDRKMGFNPAVAISFLTEDQQEDLLEAMKYTQASPSLSQAQRMKALSKEGLFTKEKAIEILSEIKKGEISRVVFKNEQLYRFFPKHYSPEQMRQKILEILTNHEAKKEENAECAK